MRQSGLSMALLGALLATPLAADQVHLKNGRVFEDVVAEVDSDSVHIHLAFGEMSLPRHMVARVVQAESSLETLQMRRDALLSNAASTTAEWLELARWALDRGLRHAAREAALQAAARDPSTPGLAPLMQSLDYVLDAATGRWIPYEESQRRRGYRLVEGRWLSPEQQIAWMQAATESARQRQQAEERSLDRAVLALAAADLARATPQPAPAGPAYAWPYVSGPFLVGPPGRFPGPPWTRPGGPRHPGPPRPDRAAIPVERRQPGSLFPIAPSQHRGGLRVPVAVSDAAKRAASGG